MSTATLSSLRVEAHITIRRGETATIRRGTRISTYTLTASSKARLTTLLTTRPDFKSMVFRHWNGTTETPHARVIYWGFPAGAPDASDDDELETLEVEAVEADEPDERESKDTAATFWADWYEDDCRMHR